MKIKFRSPTTVPISLSALSGHTVIVPKEGIDLPEKFHAQAVEAGAIAVGGLMKHPALLKLHMARESKISEAAHSMLRSRQRDDVIDGKINMDRLRVRLGFHAWQEEVDAILASEAEA